MPPAHAVDIVCELWARDEGHHFAEDYQEAVEITTEFLEREMVIPAGVLLMPPTTS